MSLTKSLKSNARDFPVVALCIEGVVMEESIWGSLPEHLIDRILARLPLHAIFRLSCVCKRLNSVIFSENFVGMHSELMPSNQPWFLTCTLGTVACAFNPSLNQWHGLTVPAISPQMCVVAAAGGLLCYGDQVGECVVLSLTNPLTKATRELLPMNRIRLIHKVGMAMDHSLKSYQIMVAGEDGLPGKNPYVYNLLTEIYDSSLNSWRMSGKPLPDAKFGSDPGVWCNGLYYCITEMPYGVVVFDKAAGVWSEVKAPLPAFLASPSLAECQGRLFMVGRVLHYITALRKARSIRMWELNVNQMEWVELEKIPDGLCAAFVEYLAPYTPFICVGLGNLICFTTWLSPHALLLDIRAGTWSQLPKDPFFPHNRNSHLMGFPFQPRLDASP